MAERKGGEERVQRSCNPLLHKIRLTPLVSQRMRKCGERADK